MATIKNDTTITDITINKRRHKATGFFVDIINDRIQINYDIIAVSDGGDELYTYKSEVVIITPERFSEADITALITKLITVIKNEI